MASGFLVYQCGLCGACALTDSGLDSHDCPVKCANKESGQTECQEKEPAAVKDANTAKSPDVYSEVKHWTKSEADLLVSTRIGMDTEFKGAKTHMGLWKKISETMSLFSYIASPKQCENKWKAIKREFKKVVDHNSKSGVEPRSCPYFDELHNVEGDSASVRPTFTLSSTGTTLKKSSLKQPTSSTITPTPVFTLSSASRSVSASTPVFTLSSASVSASSASASPSSASASTSSVSASTSSASASTSSASISTPATTYSTHSDDIVEQVVVPKAVTSRKRKEKTDGVIDFLKSMDERMTERDAALRQQLRDMQREKLSRLDRLLEIMSKK